MIKKNDLLLVGVVVILGLAVILFMNLTKEEGSKVIIKVDGEVYDTLYLSKDTSYTVELEDGTYNTFEIKGGYVDMLDASCPDKLCVNQRHIHFNKETIVCRPNRVILEIDSPETSGVDAIAN